MKIRPPPLSPLHESTPSSADSVNEYTTDFAELSYVCISMTDSYGAELVSLPDSALEEVSCFSSYGGVYLPTAVSAHYLETSLLQLLGHDSTFRPTEPRDGDILFTLHKLL